MLHSKPFESSAADRAGRSLDAMLLQARGHLDRGEFVLARELAQAVALSATTRQDRRLEARSLACMAQAERAASRFRASLEAARRAAYLFQLGGDVSGEAMALALVGCMASNLGRNDEAVEAALLSVRLEDTLPPGPQQVVAHNHLGLAYAWCRSFDRADVAFDTAARVCELCVPAVTSFNPRHNQVWAEALRLVNERYHTGRLPTLDKMHAVTDLCLRLIARGDTGQLKPGVQALAHAMARLGSALRHCWAGNAERAQAEAAAARSCIDRQCLTGTIHALGAWVQTEIAWGAQDWQAAEHHVAAMIDSASRIEHEQLAGLGQLLASQLFELQGKEELALSALHSLRQREQRAQAASLESRARLMKWQAPLRGFAASTLRGTDSNASGSAGFEDSLTTGPASRRGMQGRLAAAAQETGGGSRPSCILRVQIEDFDALCEAHSSLVGHQVAKGAAAVIKAHLHGDDFAARIGVDEFALVFHETDAAAAVSACERIVQAMTELDWSDIAPGLRPRLRAGAAPAQGEKPLLDRVGTQRPQPKSRREGGYTLIELLVVMLILSVLAMMVMPLAEIQVRHEKEHELQRALWQIRDAIDAYKRAGDEGLVAHDPGVPAYPPSLDALAQGVAPAKPGAPLMVFLRQVPRDPFADASLPAAQTWSLRSYDSSPTRPEPGANVYDVHSRSTQIGLNGVPLSAW